MSYLPLENSNNTSDVNKPVSTAGQTALDLKVNTNSALFINKTINATFDGQGVVIPINTNAILAAVGNGGTITNWFIEGNVSGSIVIDIFKNGVSMSGTGNKPTLTSAVTANAAVAGWTSVSFVTNDKIEIRVTTASTTLTKCYLTIKYNLV